MGLTSQSRCEADGGKATNLAHLCLRGSSGVDLDGAEWTNLKTADGDGRVGDDGAAAVRWCCSEDSLIAPPR